MPPRLADPVAERWFDDRPDEIVYILSRLVCSESALYLPPQSYQPNFQFIHKIWLSVEVQTHEGEASENHRNGGSL
jgi:hypothetical protein